MTRWLADILDELTLRARERRKLRQRLMRAWVRIDTLQRLIDSARAEAEAARATLARREARWRAQYNEVRELAAALGVLAGLASALERPAFAPSDAGPLSGAE